MDEAIVIPSAKAIFFTIKTIYPKYHPIWFIIYMYLIYYRIVKRKLIYHIKPLPSQLIADFLNKKYFDDVNNTVVVNKKNLYSHDKVLLLYTEGSNFYRPVYVLGIKNCKKDEIIVSDTFYHNFFRKNSKETSKCKLLEYKENFIPFADELDISLINSPFDISNAIVDGVLERFFKIPKIVKTGDIMEVNLKYYAPEIFYRNIKVNHVEYIYFKINQIKIEGDEKQEECFCVIGHTEIKQSPNSQSYLPKRFLRLAYFTCEEPIVLKEVPLCPYGLQEYLEKLERSVRPFQIKTKLPFNPVFLLQGNTGSGREILLTSLSSRLGMHFYKIYNNELYANVYAQNETKLKNAFFTGKMAVPCVICIKNFENFGKNSEGQFDERIMGFFADQLSTLFQNSLYPVFLFCCTNDKNIPTDLRKVFLETFHIEAPNDVQRELNLKWIVENENLKVDFDLQKVASKIHGFYFEDIKALVYYAKQNLLKDGANMKEKILAEKNFEDAIDFMQSNYNQSIGAPKVPKVQWSDVGGLTDVKEEIIRTINLPLKHPELLKKSGLKRSGILLFGPPGTGKTLIAKAVATECGLCFLSVKGPELLNMYVGQSEQNIREVFERAREASPCIIFFDELDSLAPNRGLSGDSGGVMDRVVSQLLAEMDGLNDSATIFIIGATNRPDLIDPALLRPGRFDKLLYIGPCTDFHSKTAVLKAQTRKFNLSKNLYLEEVVKICPTNITGADFYGICSNAWISAVKRLIKRIEEGHNSADNITHQDVIVNFEDFRTAIAIIKPSVSSEDLLYFEKLKKELGSSS